MSRLGIPGTWQTEVRVQMILHVHAVKHHDAQKCRPRCGAAGGRRGAGHAPLAADQRTEDGAAAALALWSAFGIQWSSGLLL